VDSTLTGMKQVGADVECHSNMTTVGVPDFTPTVNSDVWTHWWNSTEVGRDPLGGRPYPSLHSWTHIGLSAFVVTAIIGAGFLRAASRSETDMCRSQQE